MSQPVPPFWFKQRQAKLEPAGENTFRITAPNSAEAFLSIRHSDGRWAGVLRTTAAGPDVATTPPQFAMPSDAWGAAFELYRRQFVV
jgi:hypothetical protein